MCVREYESKRKRPLSLSVETANPIRIDCFGNHAKIITSFYRDNFFLSCAHFSSYSLYTICPRFFSLFVETTLLYVQTITIFDDDEITDHHKRKIMEKYIRNRIRNGYIYFAAK